jgi:hypothetical protein
MTNETPPNPATLSSLPRLETLVRLLRNVWRPQNGALPNAAAAASATSRKTELTFGAYSFQVHGIWPHFYFGISA